MNGWKDEGQTDMRLGCQNTFEWTGEARRLADHDQGCAGKPAI